ncbi:MAG: phage terminase family protein [Vallitalea sp.]|jgi:phage terminase large subunit-like protein|nr:phage terminase family protein [Vallitalea sp.]
MVKDSKAYKYCVECIDKDNVYVGKYIKLQAQKWKDIVDGNDKYAYIDEAMYEDICDLLDMMVHPDLRVSLYDGLEDYAWLMIVAIFCTLNREDDSRYYETDLLEISRKNFKTFNSAVIFIIGMLLEPQFSRFFSVAPDFKLSNELRLAVRKIIKSSPELEDKFKINRDKIECLMTDIEYVPLAYSNDRMDGKLATIFLADEAGAMDDYPVEAMRSSQITLRDKLGIIISTQYPNDHNVMLTEIDYAKRVLDGLIDDRRYFVLLYEPDEDLREGWETNDLVIYQSNPVAVNNKRIFDAIKKKRATAILYDSKKENYLCKHNNIMYKGLGAESYISVEDVKKCKVDKITWARRDVYIGLDLSMTSDNTSYSMVAYDEPTDTILADSFAFIPEDSIDLKTKIERLDYNKMIKEGKCFGCGGRTIDYGFIEEMILSIEAEHGVNIVSVGYDVYNCISTAQKLEKGGLDTVKIKQHSSLLHAPTKLLEEYILNGKFQYEHNRLLEINFQNARCVYDTNKNRYVNKKKSNGKVDMVVSLINALYLLQQNEILAEESWGCQTI